MVSCFSPIRTSFHFPLHLLCIYSSVRCSHHSSSSLHCLFFFWMRVFVSFLALFKFVVSPVVSCIFGVSFILFFAHSFTSISSSLPSSFPHHHLNAYISRLDFIDSAVAYHTFGAHILPNSAFCSHVCPCHSDCIPSAYIWSHNTFLLESTFDYAFKACLKTLLHHLHPVSSHRFCSAYFGSHQFTTIFFRHRLIYPIPLHQ